MDAIERMARGTGRVIELLGRLIGEPKLLLLVGIGLILLIYKRNTRADEIRQHHKDPATLLGLFTVRLWWWWRTPLIAALVAWWLMATGLAWVVVVAALGLVALRFGARPSWDLLWAAERKHQWQAKWSWRWLWAAFQADCIVRERWAMRSPYPTVRDVQVRGENAALTVRIPPRMDLETLARHEGAVGAQLRVRGLRVLPHPSNDMGLARVEVLNRVLAPGRELDLVHDVNMTAEQLLRVGYGFDGPVGFDLDQEVGLGVFGATGAGKGVLARWVAVQAVLAGHEVWVIDPQSSGEWAPFDGLPGVRLLRYDPTRAVESLDLIAQALDELAYDVAHRNRLAGDHGVDGWRYLPSEVKADVPRRLLVTDEVSSLLARVERNDPTRPLREAIGQKLGDAYRTARKAGIGFVHVDQATYAGNETYLAAGAIGQLGRWVALGGMRDETRRMISGFTDWPYVAPVPGLGLTGRRADEHPEPIEVPNVTRAQVEAALVSPRPLATEAVAR